MNKDTRELRVVLETDRLFEAPNWTLDGRWLILNGDGKLYRLAADGSGGLQEIPITGLPRANNDHCLSPDGSTIYASAEGHLYAAPLEGGSARRITRDRQKASSTCTSCTGCRLTGRRWPTSRCSPVGDDIVYRSNLALVPSAGGDDILLTDSTGFDGPEYSPDGQWSLTTTRKRPPPGQGTPRCSACGRTGRSTSS